MTYAIQSYRRDAARRLFAGWALAALAFALALAGCAPAATSGDKSVATPAPTATVAPQTLYQADWSQRAGEWTLPPHWSVVNGQLANDGESSDVIPLTIPYTVTAQNYTLTMQIRAIAAKGPGVSNMYGVVGQTPSGKLLFTAEATQVEHTLHSYALVYPADPDTSSVTFGTYDFTPGRSTRPYLWQVEGPYVSFTAGDGFIGQVKSAAPLTPARLIFLDQNVQLVIESVKITTP